MVEILAERVVSMGVRSMLCLQCVAASCLYGILTCFLNEFCNWTFVLGRIDWLSVSIMQATDCRRRIWQRSVPGMYVDVP